MAKSVNQVMVLGRLTRDAELRTTTSGKNIASFSIAVDRASQDDQADFFDVTAWEKLGELITKYTHKGSKVIVQGRLRQDTWTQDDGQKRSRVGIVATDITFLGTKSKSENEENVVIDDDFDKPLDLSEIPF